MTGAGLRIGKWLRPSGGVLSGAASLTASAATYLYTVSPGTLLATLSQPFGAGTTYATVGTVPGQLALSSGTIVAGATASASGTAYSIKIRATSADGKSEIATTLTFTASGVIVTPSGFFDYGNANALLWAA